ncbi:LuxR family transcriptional regulator [Intrasporangium mesophilum]
MAASPAPVFLGRSPERRELDVALDRVRGGESAALVIRGEAGIGKTALLRYCATRADGLAVREVAGVESELHLPFAALQQLCGPMLDSLASLPPPQSDALRVAFGLTTGTPPDRFIVGLGVLGLLADGAVEQPLLCLVDDAQWLDEASAQVLGFVARRLRAESVFLLFTVREPVDEPVLAGIPELFVSGLSTDDARELLAAAIPGHLDEQIRDRLIAETNGNPLALLEVSRGMSRAELLGGFALPNVGTTSTQFQDHYRRRIEQLEARTRQLMLLAAADPTGDATLVWRAAHTLGLGPDAATAAEAEQLLEIGSAVRFRHPLVRAAAYAAGSAQDRRDAHVALAAATDTQSDPEHRVWHLAAAATGPDPALAAELEQAAERAEACGAVPTAAALLQRSFGLTADPGQRADRALAAAHAHLDAGAFRAARGLLAAAEADATTDLQLARVELLEGQLDRASNSGRDAPGHLLRAARRLESHDLRLARNTYLEAWGAALVAGPLATAEGQLLDVSRAALRAPPSATGPLAADQLLEGLATMVTRGVSAAAPNLREAVDAFLADRVSPDQWLHWGVPAANAALALWDLDAWDALSARNVELARASGALASLAAALNVRRVVALWCGDVEAARSLGVEEEAVKEATGMRRASYGALFLAAYQGRVDAAVPLLTDVADETLARGEGLGQQITDRAAAILHLGLGHYAEARVAAERAAAEELGPFTGQALPDLVEAAARTGEHALAADALGRLTAYTAVEGSDWAAGLEARSRALTSAGGDAERYYAEAVQRLSRTRLALELARTRLLYGEWLRRERRRVEARDQLRAAHEAFDGMGADGFAAQARRELLATGEKVRKRVVDTANDLTPQEAHIARLARDGRTNPEIGAELFISARTVEWHLRKVFAKLGITSRRGLREALPGDQHAVSRLRLPSR